MRLPVQVLVVDDSAVMRQFLTTLLEADPEIKVVGTAPDPLVARDKIKALNPDVVTLDVEMPHMDGVSFLRRIMTLRPMPVVMISTLTQAGAETTLEALEIGAVDFIAKPTSLAGDMAALAIELQTKVKHAARTRVGARRAPSVAAPPRKERLHRPTNKIVLVGASTGGVEALKVLLMHLPEKCPPILITQHMPPRFTAAFAERLNRECPMTISEAKDGDVVTHGHAYIAPGAHHLKLIRHNGKFLCQLSDEPPTTGHRPSVDVLFGSGVRAAGRLAVAVILTGMGKDGAQGMFDLRQAGAVTLGQDEASSLVYGMPKAAFERGAVMHQHPLSHMAEAIMDACESTSQERPDGHALKAG
jgi:two-component system chemotaxis response regulator CheB